METAITSNNDTVGFAGDWHGNTPWARYVLGYMHRQGIDCVYQLGDFGVWHGQSGQDYRNALQADLDEYGQLLIVVPGNHENYDLLNSWVTAEDGLIYEPENPSILYTPRGHIWTHNSVRLGALGGAFSIDLEMRKSGVSWWSQEEITESDVDSLIDNMDRLGWQTVDIMLTHDIPAGCAVGSKTFNLPAHLENESYRQRMILRRGIDAAAPQFVLHGHWHKLLINEINGISLNNFDYLAEVYGLGGDGDFNNVAVAELDTKVGLSNLRIGMVE